MSKLFIIDASGFLYRSYHAIRNMTNSAGESTNALFGFIRSLLKLEKDFSPEHVLAVFDGANSIKKRKALYSEYKAHRVKMPEDLRYQIDWAKEYCQLMGIPFLNIPDVEADDVIGSVATASKSLFSEVFLCTSDKDMAQLVNNGVKILNTHKDNLILGEKEVETVYGVRPDQIIDLLAITGDSSDNVPGLPGFGIKTAASLLQEFNSLDALLEHPEKVSGKKKQETLMKEGEKALLSRKLVTIDTQVPVPLQLADYQAQTPDTDGLRQFYSKMNFNTLLKELESQNPTHAEEEECNYTLIDDQQGLKELFARLVKEKEICFDTETTALNPMEAELVGVGFAINPKEAWYIPANGELGLDTLLDALKPLLGNKSIGFYGHNIKYDAHVMANYGIKIASISFDTLLASYLLNSSSRQHSLDALSLEYFSKVKIPTADLIGKGKQQITMREVPIDKVATYCCEDVDYTCRLKKRLEKDLKERKLDKLFYQLELPLLSVLITMERNGIYLDIARLQEMGKTIQKQIHILESKIYELAGETFNLNSPKQLSHILFEKLGIHPPKKTATGFSTNAEVLESLKHNYPIAEKIHEYRTLEKLRSTYIESLPHMVNPKTERIHTTFNQTITATGRLSSTDPNLQNIPIRSEIGRKIRSAFRPQKKGWSYLSADYSQIELRLVAHFSEDPHLIEAFNRGEDIHAHTAATVFDIPLDQVTKEMRYRAKAVNFGIIYGQQAFGLSKELGIEFKEAKSFIDTYFNRFPSVKDYLESCKDRARKEKKAVTYTGRERTLPEINSKNPQIRAAAERLSVNTPLQGSAADLIKNAMIAIQQDIIENGHLSMMILQIHDELIFEVPDFEIPAVEAIVKRRMESALKLRVPLIVNIEIGKNWEEC